eukprot:3003804-Amphidinium_carterae.1
MTVMVFWSSIRCMRNTSRSTATVTTRVPTLCSWSWLSSLSSVGSTSRVWPSIRCKRNYCDHNVRTCSNGVTVMWGAFAVLASASLEVLGLAVKFAVELVDLLVFGTDFANLWRLIGSNAGRAELPDLSALFRLVVMSVFEIHLGCQTDHFSQLVQHRARRQTSASLT